MDDNPTTVTATPEALRDMYPDIVATIEADAAEAAAKAVWAEGRAELARFGEAFPDDPCFALDRFIAGDTLVEAKGAYADALRDRLAAEQEKHAAALEAHPAADGRFGNR